MKRALLVGCVVVAIWAVAGPAARAANQEAIDKAVERGAAFLHKRPAANQDFNMGVQPVGAGALVGLTLLECGAGPDDEVIKCMMPLTTSHAELEEGLDILERAITEEFGTIATGSRPLTAPMLKAA